MNEIYISKTKKSDKDFYLRLRNNKDNRKKSFNSKIIKKKDHNQWFLENYSKNYYYTCFKGPTKIGYIRGDICGDIINISIVIDQKYQNKKFASICFNLFEKKIRKNSIFIAKMRSKNTNSINFFKRNEFIKLNSQKSFYSYYKIHKLKQDTFEKTINKIQGVRKNNNINWMNILRLAFKNSPEETSNIFKKVYESDKQINQLSKKLF